MNITVRAFKIYKSAYFSIFPVGMCRVPRCFMDHLTVPAPSLEIGAAFVHDVVGVLPQIGGEHPRMGTHNLLLRLSGDPEVLEDRVRSFASSEPAACWAPSPGRASATGSA